MIDKIISFSINNKPVIWLMTIGLIIGGIWSMTKVPLDAMPDITNNQVLVITTAPNLATEDIEQFVTYQVELAVANLPGVVEIRSVSRFGLSVVTIVFEESSGTYLPRQLVSEALIEVKEKIPEGFGEPFMAPISTGLGEIYQYTLEVEPGYDTIYDDMELRTIQDWIVKRQMAMLPGVAEVNSFGGRKKQYEVAVNPDKLKSMGLTITDVFEALRKNNQNTGGAYIEKNHKANFIRGEGLMRSLDDVKNTKVAYIERQPVFIRDIAEVKYGNFVRYGAFIKNGKGEAVGGIVMMLKGENSNDVIKAVKERVELIKKSLPEGVTIKPFLDRSKLIKSTTNTVAENLAIGALIVIFVLVIFLGNLREGLIVASSIPLALLFAFIMMKIFGVWANLMSLGALDFGILVDGAVIIVESMIFYLHRKNLIGTKLPQKKRDGIAFRSASKMMNAAFFGQLIILIVFIPVLALQGVEGKMFIPMALTFGFAVIGVVVLCLTYIPMMVATFLQPPKTDKKSWGERVIFKLENIYGIVLEKVLKNSKTVLVSALLLIVTGWFLFSRMGAEFIPKLDEGDFAFQTFYMPGTSLSEVTESTNKIQKEILEKFPDEIKSIQSRIGVADLPMDPMPLDIADNFVILEPKSNWKNADTKKELIEKIETILKNHPGINFEFTQPIEMRFNELLTGIREDIAIKLYGDDLNILSEKAKEIEKLIGGIDGIGGIKVDATKGLPQITVKYDRNSLARYNLDINELNRVIETAFSGGVAGKIYNGERMFDLVVRLDKEHRQSINDIRDLYVNLPDGTQIPLKEVAEVSYKPGPMQIGRDNTNRRTYVGINVEDRDIKSLVNEISKTLDAKLQLPAGYYIRYGGAFENLERASKRLTLVVPLALALIFILVFFAVKSIKQTLMIYIAIPFAAVGGIFSLYLRDMPFSISAGVGFIVLFGVAVLNGLVLISGFNQMKAEGKFTLAEIIKQGSIRRLRPILLTASTDILGFLPMAISASAGAEVQRPLATVVIGGMITSTLLTLIVLPILYKIVESAKRKLKMQKAVIAVSVILIMFASPQILNAQQKKYTLQQFINEAKKEYPSLKVSAFELEKQKTLKSTAFEPGTTTLYSGREETKTQMPGVQNIIGVEQSGIDVLGIFSKNKLGEANIKKAQIEMEISEEMLVRDIRSAWYDAVYYKQKWLFFLQMDSLYADFEKAAKIRYKTQATSQVEFLSASAKYKSLSVKIQKAESEYRSAIFKLKQFLPSNGDFDIDISGVETNSFTIVADTLTHSPILSYYSQNTEVAMRQWNVEKSNLLPKFNMEYKLQSVDGNSGFYAWQIGMSFPLVFFSQTGKNKAMKLEYNKSDALYRQKELEINTLYKQLLKQYQTLQKVLEYYKNEALPLSDKQIKAASTAYKVGSIDYVQFIQNTEAAINTKLDFLKQQNQFLKLSAQLKYLTGSN